jgi:tRNA-Thr(GGU) m(6)t(6)A37 methyltransferase TsaA
MNRQIKYIPIGVINTPFRDIDDMPIQPIGAKGVSGTIELKNSFVEGLDDLLGFSHIMLLYHFHMIKKFEMSVIPFMDNKPHGIFATRSPVRPNPIGISIVRLKSIDKNILHILDVDILDGTPLLDIKPFIASFDSRNVTKCGWFTGKEKLQLRKSDNRFTNK